MVVALVVAVVVVLLLVVLIAVVVGSTSQVPKCIRANANPSKSDS